MSNELLPCPSCGNELYRSPRNHNPKAYCVTEDCYGKRMSVVNLDDPIIVAMWNARAGAAATAVTDPVAEMIYFKRRGSDVEDRVPALLNGSAVDPKLITRREPLYTSHSRPMQREDGK